MPAVSLPSAALSEGMSCIVGCCHESAVVMSGVWLLIAPWKAISLSASLGSVLVVASLPVCVSGEPGVMTMPVGSS